MKLLLASVVLCFSCTACFPLFLGTKSIRKGDFAVDFITGADVGFSVNGIDTVNDNRGIKPKGSYQNETNR